MPDTLEPGSIAWVDLTVPDAPTLRDFYSNVIGWRVENVAMERGAYQDFSMATPESNTAVAGVCHARGGNAGLPPVWLIYFTVEDLDASLEECRARGGQVLAGPKNMGAQARYAVIADPSGAACALIEQMPNAA